MFSFLKGNIIITLSELNVTFDVKILKFSCKTNNILGFIYNLKNVSVYMHKAACLK